jgi:hypothetical protein
MILISVVPSPLALLDGSQRCDGEAVSVAGDRLRLGHLRDLSSSCLVLERDHDLGLEVLGRGVVFAPPTLEGVLGEVPSGTWSLLGEPPCRFLLEDTWSPGKVHAHAYANSLPEFVGELPVRVLASLEEGAEELDVDGLVLPAAGLEEGHAWTANLRA